MTYGERILLERRRRKLRQPELAARLGLNPQTIVDIERGRLEITEGQFHRIMAVLQQDAQVAV